MKMPRRLALVLTLFCSAPVALPVLANNVITLGGFNVPDGVAVDGSGNVFVAETGSFYIKEMLAPTYTTTNTLGDGTALNHPAGVAVDATGNVFFSDSSYNTVKRFLASSYTASASSPLGSGFILPQGVAVDGGGNVYVGDPSNYAVYEIVAAGGYTTVRTLVQDVPTLVPYGVAVDGSGNVFFSDYYVGVKEILAVGGVIPASPTIVTIGSGFHYPRGVAVDGDGNVFVADSGNSAVKEILAPDYTKVYTIGAGGGFYLPHGVAVDNNGHVFVADTYNAAVKEILFPDDLFENGFE